MNDNHDQMEPSTQTAGSGADWRTNWTPNRRRFLSLTGLALGGAAIGLGTSACGTAQTGSSAGQEGSKGRAGAAGETLFVAGFQWGPPKSFNPLAAVPDWPTGPGPKPVDLRELAALQHPRRLAYARAWRRSYSSLTTKPLRCRCRTPPSGPTDPTLLQTTSSSPSSLARRHLSSSPRCGTTSIRSPRPIHGPSSSS